MARPLKEGLDYFSHDVDMSDDEKIIAMEAIHGDSGYAFYCKLLERIYHSPGGFIEVKEDWQKQVLCSRLRKGMEEFTALLNTSIDIGLFNKDLYQQEGKLSSNGVMKRRAEVLREREYMRTWREGKTKQVDSKPTESLPQPNSKIANPLQTKTPHKTKYGHMVKS